MAKNWAISIGINGYKFTSLYPLKYAKQDAALIENFFRNDVGFDQVWLFSDDSPEIRGESTHPYRTPLLRFFRNQFKDPFMDKEDSLWLFFSGHGIRYADRDYLLPIDGDPEAPEDTAISLNYISERVSRSGAGNVVLILDACRIEGRKGKGFGDNLYEGITTIFSCRPYESSWEIGEPISQGAFTYVLVENLRRQLNGSYLTVEQTEQDLQQKLPILNQKYGKPSQTPHIKCDFSGKANQYLFPDSVLSKKLAQKTESSQGNRKRSATQHKSAKNVLLLKSDAFKAEEIGQFEAAKQLWFQIVVNFPSEREAAIKSIDRIAMRLASQPFLSTTLEKETQLTHKSEPGTNILPTPRLGTKDKANHQDRELIIPFVSGTQSVEFEVLTVDAKGEESNRYQKQAQCLIERLNGVVLEMLVIPGGTFLMGSSERKPLPNELPAHWVTVKPFLLSRYPITKEQWKEIAKLPKVHQELKLRPSIKGSKGSPVVQISWYEAIEFCNRLTQSTGYHYSLPTEAEWEYACRAGTQTPFHFGETITSALANYDGSHIYCSEQKGINREKLMPVCSFPFANAFGLHEMHGNIWEWCLDSWHENYEDAPKDGKAWMDNGENINHVVRGGALSSGPTLCRSTSRAYDSANNRSNNIGFRIARSIK